MGIPTVSKFKRLLSDLRHIRDTNARLELLERKVKKLNSELYNVLPETLTVNARTEAAIAQVRQEHPIPENLNIRIAQNDLMFHFSHFYEEDFTKTYISYLLNGLNPMNICRRLAEHKFGRMSEMESFLDFASGYGRLTRYLITEMDPKKVWVSDIKEKATDFQVTEFGVHGVPSSYDPKEFQPGRQFDFIYVGSLFSHLPEETFLPWLEVLLGLLSDRGILAISVHDSSLMDPPNSADFHFIENSEDKLFDSVDDHIEDAGKYGITFCSEAYVRKALQKFGFAPEQYKRYPRALSKLQDVYAITREANVFDDSIQFEHWP
ncbi:MAG: methyltransferase domain-containing protein [Bacteroidota bacterium]